MDKENPNENLDEKIENEEENEVEQKSIENVKNTEINNTSKEVKKVTNEKVKYIEKNDKKQRKGDREIVVEYRRPSFFMSLLLILIGVMIATIVLLLLYIFKGQKEVVVYKEPETEVVQEEPKEEVKKLDLSIDGEFVQDLYAKIPMQTTGYEPYYSTGATAGTIDDNKKLLFTLRSLEKEYKYEVTDDASVGDKLDNKYFPDLLENYGNINRKEIKKFDFDTVKAKYKSIFGTNLEVPLIDAETNMGYVYEYVASDNCFYGHHYDGGGGTGIVAQEIAIDKCEQNEDGTEVYIYDDFLIFVYDSYTADEKYRLYDSSDITTPLTEQLSKEYVNDVALYGGYTAEQIIEDNKDKAGHFKHTFKLDSDGNYYWYSSEMVD